MRPFIPARFEFLAFGAVLTCLMTLLVAGISTLRAVGPAPNLVELWLTAWLAGGRISGGAVRRAAGAAYSEGHRHRPGGAAMNFDTIVVGRTPLGSAIRAVAVTILLGWFWDVLLSGFWQRTLVTLVTAIAIVVAAHWISRRDNPWGSSGDGFGG